jgi:hypothetical protein
VKTGCALPNVPQLVRELTAPTYEFRNGKFRLEETEQIKARLGFSPDIADALALTFAMPLPPRRGPGAVAARRAQHAITEPEDRDRASSRSVMHAVTEEDRRDRDN